MPRQGLLQLQSMLLQCLLFRTWKTYSISKGAKFALQRKKQATELTSEMLARLGSTLHCSRCCTAGLACSASCPCIRLDYVCFLTLSCVEPCR
jgi:hypothetical protein